MDDRGGSMEGSPRPDEARASAALSPRLHGRADPDRRIGATGGSRAAGQQSTLPVYIDDATSRLMHLQFVESESTFDYFAATRAYLERHGKPVAFYSDKHGVFRVNKKDAVGGDGMTQFGRALHALNIDIICANSSQAKGRVERANGTLQDRLVKEMRLRGIDTVAAGNAFLPT